MKEFVSLLCVVDIFSKYAWALSLKNKKRYYNHYCFSKISKFSEFCNRSMKSWLEKIDIEMYSTHNEGKRVVAERFIKTLKNKIYKYMTLMSKNIHKIQIHKLDDLGNKYNNTYCRTMKPVDVNSGTYIDSSKEVNDKDPNLKLVILLEYQNIKTFL